MRTVFKCPFFKVQAEVVKGNDATTSQAFVPICNYVQNNTIPKLVQRNVYVIFL